MRDHHSLNHVLARFQNSIASTADRCGRERPRGQRRPDDESDGQDGSPGYTRSITADQAAGGVNETDEYAALAPLATRRGDPDADGAAQRSVVEEAQLSASVQVLDGRI